MKHRGVKEIFYLLRGDFPYMETRMGKFLEIEVQ